MGRPPRRRQRAVRNPRAYSAQPARFLPLWALLPAVASCRWEWFRLPSLKNGHVGNPKANAQWGKFVPRAQSGNRNASPTRRTDLKKPAWSELRKAD
jgi:hypothetical protein